MKPVFYLLLSIGLLLGCSSKKELASEIVELTKKSNFTDVKTRRGIVTVPGIWTMLNFEESSGQHYLQNEEGVIIAVAKNQKETFPFYRVGQTNFEAVAAYTQWEIEHHNKKNRRTKVIKQDPRNEFIIWKFMDDTAKENLFLFGTIGEDVINLLIYTEKWTGLMKIAFLENTYKRYRN